MNDPYFEREFALIEGTLENAIEDVVEFLNDQMPVDQGELSDSWGMQKIGPETYQFYSVEEYFPALEAGRSPGTFAPVMAIEGWVRRKITSDSKEANSIAWAIIQKWKAEGRQGSDILGFGGELPGELLDQPKPGGIYDQLEEMFSLKFSP